MAKGLVSDVWKPARWPERKAVSAQSNLDAKGSKSLSVDGKKSIEHYFRPDAVEPRDQLNESQKAALETVLSLLARAILEVKDRAQRRSENLRTRHLVESVSNHVIFISGKRGSGKSSLLRCIDKACLLQPEQRQEYWGIEPGPNSLDQVIWLDTIDMERMDHSGNLLASILVRFDHLLHGRENEEVTREYRSLTTDVSLAWGDLISSSMSDADTRSIEALRWEQANLDFMEKFSHLLDEIASKMFNAGLPKDPVFVIPIDDCDLNPQRGLNLLRLIRKLSQPRLVFLVLGDLEMLNHLNELYYANEVAKMGEVAFNAGIFSGARVASYVQGMARDAFDKLVPPHQRLELRPLGLKDAAGFKPCLFGAKTVAQEALKTLARYLNHLPVEIHYLPSSFISLSAYLGISPVSTAMASPSTSDKAEQDVPLDLRLSLPYLGQEVLLSSPRRLLDQWFYLRNLVESNSWTEIAPPSTHSKDNSSKEAITKPEKTAPVESTISFLEWGLKAAIQSDTSMSPHLRQKALEKWFERNHDNNIVLNPAGVTFLPLNANSKTVGQGTQIRWGVKIEVRYDGHVLSPGVAGWLTLLHDVLNLCRRAGIRGESPVHSLRQSCGELYSLAKGEQLLQPEFQSIRSYQIAFFLWTELLQSRGLSSDDNFYRLAWAVANLAPLHIDNSLSQAAVKEPLEPICIKFITNIKKLLKDQPNPSYRKTVGSAWKMLEGLADTGRSESWDSIRDAIKSEEDNAPPANEK